MDIVSGMRLVVSLKIWSNGLTVVKGIEWVRVVAKFVGGSYL